MFAEGGAGTLQVDSAPGSVRIDGSGEVRISLLERRPARRSRGRGRPRARQHRDRRRRDAGAGRAAGRALRGRLAVGADGLQLGARRRLLSLVAGAARFTPRHDVGRRTCRRISTSTRARSIRTARGATWRRTATCGIRPSRRRGVPTITASGGSTAGTAGHSSVTDGRWLYPTHHYGRWGLNRGRWYWMPSRGWSRRMGALGGGAGIRWLVPARMEQPSRCSGSGDIAATTTATTLGARGRSSMPARSAAATPAARVSIRGVPWRVGAVLRRPADAAAHRGSARIASSSPNARASLADDRGSARLRDARLSQFRFGRRGLVAAVARLQRTASFRVDNLPSRHRAAPSGDDAGRDRRRPHTPPGRTRIAASRRPAGRGMRTPGARSAACHLLPRHAGAPRARSNPANAYERAGVAVPRNLPGSAGSSRPVMPDGARSERHRNIAGRPDRLRATAIRRRARVGGCRRPAPLRVTACRTRCRARTRPYSGPRHRQAPSAIAAHVDGADATDGPHRPACPGPRCASAPPARTAPPSAAPSQAVPARRSLATLRRSDADVGASRSHRPPGRHRGALRARGDGRQRQRPAVRVGRRHAAGLGARRLRAEHDHPRLRRRRPGGRRVRHAAARRHHLTIRSRRCFVRRSSPPRIRPSTPTSASASRASSSPRSRTSSAGERAGASTLTQQLARNLFLTNEKTLDRKIKEAIPDDSDREALHEARDLHALLQSHSVGPRHLRRRSRVAPLLRQVGKGPDARGSGAAGRDHSAPVAAEPVRQPRRGAPAPQLRAAADGRRTVHLAGARRPGQAGADCHERPAGDEYLRAVLPRGRPPAPRGALRRQAAVRERARRATRRSTPICSVRPRRRSTPACAKWTSAAASASRAATSSPTVRRSTRFQHDRWKAPIRVGDIVPAVVVALRRRRAARGAARPRSSCGPDAITSRSRSRATSGRARKDPTFSSLATSCR